MSLIRAWTSFKERKRGPSPKHEGEQCRYWPMLWTCFPFFTSQHFTKFSSQLRLSCFAIFSDWKEAEPGFVNGASRELQEQMWSEEISEHQFPDRKSCFPVSARSIPSLQSWSHLCWIPVLPAWDILDPCCFRASSAINSTVVPKSFFLSLWTEDVSEENCFFPPFVKAKKPRVVLSFVIYT